MNKLKNLIDRDSLGEKIIFLYQEQVDKLIEIICNVAEHLDKNATMTKQDFARISMDNINKVQAITEKKQKMLDDYKEKSEILYGG